MWKAGEEPEVGDIELSSFLVDGKFKSLQDERLGKLIYGSSFRRPIPLELDTPFPSESL